MLDLERATAEQRKVAESAINDGEVLAELLDGLLSKKCVVRYGNFKAVYLISEAHPEVLYPKWDFFEKLLKSNNNTHVFYAIHVLANLAKVDVGNRFEKVFREFYGILNGDALVPACHVAYVSHKIVDAKPELAAKITERLLDLGKARYKHKELVQANALSSLSKYFDLAGDKDRVICLAKDLMESKSPRARREAVNFLDKWVS